MKKNILFFLANLLFLNIYSQEIELIKATSKKWSGGKRGDSGTHYNIIFQTKETIIEPYTLWIDGQFYPLELASDINSQYDSVSRITTYSIFISIGGFENYKYQERWNAKRQKQGIDSKLDPVIKFNGAALITYHYKGKQCFFTIKDFVKIPYTPHW